MKERPMLFSAPMVRAILDGSKTQTRRALKKQPPSGTEWFSTYHHPDPRPYHWAGAGGDLLNFCLPCPYGAPGDRLWVRETFARIDGQTQPWIETDYRATYQHGDRLGDTLGIKKRWTPAIHMPRAASRINLEITGVRVERLRNISEADALAEGIPEDGPPCARCGSCGWVMEGGDPVECSATGCGDGAVDEFRRLWESINGPGSWDANPWVWVIEFKRIDAMKLAA